MRNYRINKINHTVFDSVDEVPSSIDYLSNWRKGTIGDWVLADDGAVLQVLRKGKMMKARGANRCVHYIGTCTGTFPAYKHAKMDTSKRINIYSFGGGKLADDVLIERVNLSKCEQVFVVYLASGLTPQEAYMKAYPTNDPGYAKFKSTQLVKTTRIRTAMKEELKPVLEELKLDETFVLKNIKEVILSSEKDDTRLKALFKLADIMDMEDKTRTQQTTLAVGAFKGFSDDMIQVAERPKEIE